MRAQAGAPDPVSLDAQELPPAAVLLISDGVSTGGLDPLEAAKAAAREFIRAMPPEVEIGLVAFSSYPTLLHPPHHGPGAARACR